MTDVGDRAHPGDFTALAQLLLRTRGNRMEMRALIETDRLIPPRVARIVREASPAGVTAEGSWAEGIADATIAARAFLEALRSEGVFDRLVSSMRPVPLRTRALAATQAVVGGEVAEAAPKPISTLTLANHALAPRKTSTIVVVSDELAEAGGREAGAFIANEMRRGTIAATDAALLSGLIDSGSPAVGPSAGATLANMKTDLAELLAAVHVRGGARLFWVLGIAAANGAAALDDLGGMSPLGGTLLGLPAMVTDQIATDSAMLINAGEIAANAGTVELDTARHAALQLATDPATGAQNQTSLWQTGCRAVRAERTFGFQRLTADAAAEMTSVGWAAS